MDATFQRITPGRPLSARSLNGLQAEVSLLSRMTAVGAEQFAQTGAGTVLSQQEVGPRLMVRILGQAKDGAGNPLNQYAFAQVMESLAGPVVCDGWSGDGATFWAAEENGGLGVPAGGVYPAQVSEDGLCVVFAGGGAGGGTPLKAPASTAAQAPLNVPLGVAPTTPQPGDLYPVTLGGKPVWVYAPGPVGGPTYSFASYLSGVPTAGALLIADGAGGWTPATLTAGSGVSIVDASGSVTISVTGGVTTFNTRTGAVTLTLADVVTALGGIQTGDLGTALVTLGLMSGTPTLAAANLTGTLSVANLPAAQSPALGSTLTLSGSLSWVDATIGFADLQVAANSKTLDIYNIPSGSVLHAIEYRTSTAFTGVAISGTTLGFRNGDSGASNVSRYGSIALAVTAALPAFITTNQPDVQAITQAWTLTLTINATTNLSNLTTGVLAIRFLLSQPG